MRFVRRRYFLVALSVFFIFNQPATPAEQPALRFDAATQTVEATGLPPALIAPLAEIHGLERAFAVYLGDAKLPILGDYEAVGRTLRFSPRFPFVAGRLHRATLDLPALCALTGMPPPPGASVVTMSFSVPELVRTSKARVTAVFPSADSLPANTLRFYVYFSEPMTRRAIAKSIRLEEASGKPVRGAFLEMEDGLWDPASKRLTVFLHPGRIKRGLALHEREGQPLKAGVRYRLVVDRGAEDEDGQPLISEFVKEFIATKEDRTTPDSARWKVIPPARETTDVVALTTDRPLDHALFARVIRVTTAYGRPIPGEARVDAGETRWRFTPYARWQSGKYLLHLAPELEDPAGNRLTRLFDEEIHGKSEREEAREVVIFFEIR